MGLAELTGQCCLALVERRPVGLMPLVHVDLCSIQLSLYLSDLVSDEFPVDRLDLIRGLLLPAIGVGLEGYLLFRVPANQSLFCGFDPCNFSLHAGNSSACLSGAGYGLPARASVPCISG